MKTRTVAPLSARILSIVSLALSLFWILAYIVCVVFQRDIRIALNYPEEVINYWMLPVTPLIVNGILALVQSVFGILLLAFWKKAVWSKGAAIAFVSAEVGVYALCSVLDLLLSSLESVWVGQYRGYTALAAMSSVTQSLSFVSGLFGTGITCMIIALSLLCYRCGFDAERQRTGGIPA